MVTADLSKSEVECVTEIIWRLSEYRGKTQARTEVLKLVTELVDADYSASFVWDVQRKKSTQRVAVNISDAALDHYDQYFYQIDHGTPALRACVSATNVDNVIARPQLLDSEFYVDFLKRRPTRVTSREKRENAQFLRAFTERTSLSPLQRIERLLHVKYHHFS